MNDVYLSLEPIHEYFKTYSESPINYITRFFRDYYGCYCFRVNKIVLNTRMIIVDKVNVNMIIDHEVMHHILDKYFDENTRTQWDNINLIVENYIWKGR